MKCDNEKKKSATLCLAEIWYIPGRRFLEWADFLSSRLSSGPASAVLIGGNSQTLKISLPK